MNVSSSSPTPDAATDYNEQSYESSSSTNLTTECSTSATQLQSSFQPFQTIANITATNSSRTDINLPSTPTSRISTEKFASQAAAAALSLCTDSDSPEDDDKVSILNPLHSSRQLNLKRQNRKCKSAVIQVDGRSFTIGMHSSCFYL